MRVLITGGGGYIGSVLAGMLLEKGHEVTVLDRFFFGEEVLKDIADRITMVKGDVRWTGPEIMKGVDAVVDMAAISNDPAGELSKEKTLQINFEGRVKIGKMAKQAGVKRYIAASSCSVYGFSDSIPDETSKVNPLTTYAEANILWENGVLPLSDKNFSVTVFRQATVYGLSNRMRFDLAINAMTLALFSAGEVSIQKNGEQWRPFVHVRDTSNAFIKALETDAEVVNGQIFNVGSNEQNYQIMPLARLVAESLGLEFKYKWFGSPDNRSYRVNFDKIAEKLDFKPKYTPAEGAKEVYEAIKSGRVDPNSDKTITVKWYKELIEIDKILKEIKINDVIL